MVDGEYVTKDAFYSEIAGVRSDLAKMELGLTTRMMKLETHFNEELKRQVATSALRTKIMSAAAGAAASAVILLLQRMLGA